ncbi:MAG TPA: DUF4129 domain-containing protein [Candidatus Acidoferrum sp.]|jgi:hypothetical protein|nr:DUF4129 domain-containing protein [Candidatus Acidoferrum sp.]
MKCCLLLALVLLSCRSSPAAFGRASGTASANAAFDPGSFAAEIHRLKAILQEKTSPDEIAAFRDSVPAGWTVVAPERTYFISSEPLRNQLTSLPREKALAWMNRLAEEIESYSAVHPENSSNARAELDHILTQPEFAAVRPPSAWDLLRQRITAWFERLLVRLFSSMGRHPIAGRVLFWLIVVGGVVCIALWLFRFLVSRDRLDSLQPSASLIASPSWQEWIRAAREAASRGDFREAVHSVYWAGIVRLEDAGVVPQDRTKTPREYLRMVAEPAPGELGSRPAHHEPLAALTSRLERVWYANRGAGPEDFQESLRQLEALGCHLE